MGEARRRAQRRAEARTAGTAFRPEPYLSTVSRYRELRLTAPVPLMEAIERERDAFNAVAVDIKLSTEQYLLGLIEAAAERERQVRERAKAEQEAREQLVQSATPGQTQRVLGHVLVPDAR